MKKKSEPFINKVGRAFKGAADVAEKVNNAVLLPIGMDILTAPERAVRGTVKGLQDTPKAVMANIRMLQNKGTKEDVETLKRFEKNSTDAIEGSGTLASTYTIGKQGLDLFKKKNPELVKSISKAIKNQKGGVQIDATVSFGKSQPEAVREALAKGAKVPAGTKLDEDGSFAKAIIRRTGRKVILPEDVGLDSKDPSILNRVLSAPRKASRPAEALQRELEVASNKSDWKTVKILLDSIPKDSPYKRSMETLFRGFVK